MDEELLSEIMTRAQELIATKNKKEFAELLKCFDRLYYHHAEAAPKVFQIACTIIWLKCIPLTSEIIKISKELEPKEKGVLISVKITSFHTLWVQ